MKLAALTLLSATLLTACSNLTAQLIEGKPKGTGYPYVLSYTSDGRQHALTITFLVDSEGKVIDFNIESEAATGGEQAHHYALEANGRKFIQGMPVSDIQLPSSLADESEVLMQTLQTAVNQLKKDVK